MTRLRLFLNQLPILWSQPDYTTLAAFTGQPVWPLVRFCRSTGLLRYCYRTGRMGLPVHRAWWHDAGAHIEGLVLRAAIRVGVLDVSQVPEGGYYRWGRWTLNVRQTRRNMAARRHLIARNIADLEWANAEFRRDREQQAVRARLEASL